MDEYDPTESSGTPAKSAAPPPRRVTTEARLASRDDAEALGAMYARAFADDPVWEWLCGKRIRRFTRRAAPFFATEARRHIELGTAWTTPGGASGALWAPPGRWQIPPVDIARWAPSALRVFGLRLPISLITLSEVDKIHPREPHYYLALLASDPERRGHGLGAAAIEPALKRCDREGLPAYLESSKEANVAFYERYGFRVTQRITLGRKSEGPPMWLMWRTPQTPQDH